jgi:hypothetical protein
MKPVNQHFLDHTKEGHRDQIRRAAENIRDTMIRLLSQLDKGEVPYISTFSVAQDLNDITERRGALKALVEVAEPILNNEEKT